jgi:hypothetical protein
VKVDERDAISERLLDRFRKSVVRVEAKGRPVFQRMSPSRFGLSVPGSQRVFHVP